MSQPIQNDRIARLLEMTSTEREVATLDELEQRLAEGEHLQEICAAWDVPRGRVLAWLMADAKRYAVYERALEVAAHALIAETVPIADGEGFPQNKRIRIETRFRVAQAHAREKYGRREDEAPSTLVLVADLDRVADMLLGKLGAVAPARLIEHEIEPDPNEGEI